MTTMIPPFRLRTRTPLTVAQILAWADDFWVRTGGWPSANSGPVGGPLNCSWGNIQRALQLGLRGLPGGDSLSRLLRRTGRIGERRGRPPQPARHFQAAMLRAKGLSLAQVGRQLGISRQAAWDLLRRTGAAREPQPCLQSNEAEPTPSTAHGASA